MFTPKRSLNRSPVRGHKPQNKIDEELETAKMEDFYECLAEVNVIIGKEKISADNKSKIFGLLSKFQKELDFQKSEKEKLQREVEIYKELYEKNVNNASSPSYAQVVGTTINRKEAELEKLMKKKTCTLFISSAKNKSATEVKKVVASKLKPTEEKIKIHSMRTAGEKAIVIEAETSEDAQRIMKSKNLTNEDLKIEVAKKKNPLIILYDVLKWRKEEEMKEDIYHQNFDTLIDKKEFEEGFKFKFKTGPRKEESVHHVVEVTPNIRKIIISKRKLYLGFQAVNVKDFVSVAKCAKCQAFGHVAKFCNRGIVCGRCGEKDHNKNDCTKKEEDAICVPCFYRKKECKDRENCPTYKMYWERAVSRINYE